MPLEHGVRFLPEVMKIVLRLLSVLESSKAAREQLGVFASSLALNASLFAVLFFASLQLEPSEFAKLSIASNTILLLANVLNLGLNYGALRLSIEHKSSSFVAINFCLKAVLFAVGVSLFLIWTLILGLRGELVILVAASGVAFWASAVTVIQYKQQFRRFALLNVALASTRIVFGIIATFSQNWVIIILAVQVLAQVPIHLFTITKGIGELRSAIIWRDTKNLFTLSPIIFVSGTLSSTLPLITQSLLYSHSGKLATSSFGVVLLFTAPLQTVVNTLYIYLLPQVLSRSIRDVDAFGLGRGSITILACGFAGALFLAAAPIAIVLDWIYGTRMPQVSSFFITYFGAVALSLSVSLHNFRAQRGKLIRIELIANLLRAAATALLGLFPLGAYGLVAWSAAIMAIGECALWVVLKRAEQFTVTSE